MDRDPQAAADLRFRALTRSRRGSSRQGAHRLEPPVPPPL